MKSKIEILLAILGILAGMFVGFGFLILHDDKFDTKLISEKEPKFLQKQEQLNLQIPSWVKHSAGWWSEDRISDQEYITSLQYLIDNGIIKTKP
jgi:hypothetical protein